MVDVMSIYCMISQCFNNCHRPSKQWQFWWRQSLIFCKCSKCEPKMAVRTLSFWKKKVSQVLKSRKTCKKCVLSIQYSVSGPNVSFCTFLVFAVHEFFCKCSKRVKALESVGPWAKSGRTDIVLLKMWQNHVRYLVFCLRPNVSFCSFFGFSQIVDFEASLRNF